MTVSELERATRASANWPHVNTEIEHVVLDLIADWRLMREALIEAHDADVPHWGKIHAALHDLKLKP